MRIDRLDLPDISDGFGDDPKPGSRQALQRRLDDLSHGHPSSPYHEDGSPRPPVPDVREYELPEAQEPAARPDRPLPLTDAEHADHVREIRACLDKARADGLATDHQHTIDLDGDAWDKDRRADHDSIIENLYGSASDVPANYQAIVAGGLSGSGKSTVLEGYSSIDRSQYLTIDPDKIKEEMAHRGLIPAVEGLSPMEACDLVHEESSHIARQLAVRAQTDGKNVIWDITMSSRASTERRIEDLRSAGYTSIEGVFVDIPVETSVARAAARHREGHDDYRAGDGLGGRFVPAEVIRGQADSEWGSLNRKTFETIKHGFDRWSLFDNSADGGPPVLLDSRQRKETAL